MRALAVLMMVQDHTIDVLLSDQYRDYAYPLFGVWSFIRGLTAPIFLFTAGAAFMYLFRSTEAPFKENPRVFKGIKRFLLLMGVGYLLRYPTPTITDFTFVTEQSWRTFWGVDVLQLIGVSLLFLLLAAFIAEKCGRRDFLIFPLGSMFFFFCHPLFERIDWASFMPIQLAGYFYSGSGSVFPIFPWTGYVFCGGVLGCYLAGSSARAIPFRISPAMLIGGALALTLSPAMNWLSGAFTGAASLWAASVSLSLLRLGGLFLVCAVVSFIATKLNSIPPIVIWIGRQSLPIYALHLIILYGSAWNMGLNQVVDKRFDAWESVGAGLLMSVLMIGFAWFLQRSASLFREALSGPRNRARFQESLDEPAPQR